MAFYCNGKKGICDKISSSLGVCPLDCEFGDGTGGYDVAVPMPKPMTRADYLRSASDGELAWAFMEFRFDAFGAGKGNESALPNTQKKILDWLKQPYEEERNENCEADI